MSEWETFCDISYYHLWRVRRKDERGFNDGYHLQHGEEAKALVELLNGLERERRERDEAMEALENLKASLDQIASLYESKEMTATVCQRISDAYANKHRCLGDRPERDENGNIVAYYEACSVPDYCNDLNAMHEAEKVLNDEQWLEYREELRNVVLGGIRMVSQWCKADLHATARQRAEAFLKTLGKWEGAK